jgi:hypothetical protein
MAGLVSRVWEGERTAVTFGSSEYRLASGEGEHKRHSALLPLCQLVLRRHD